MIRFGLALVLAAQAAVLFGTVDVAGADPPLRVHVRVEGSWASIYRGWIDVPDTVTFTAYNSGQTYTVEGETPFGALVAATQQAGIPLDVTDEFLGIDLSVDAVGGEAWVQGIRWWDYRVNYVATYYGSHYGYLAAGPSLQTGDSVLWYPENVGITPLRLSYQALASDATTGCVYGVRVEQRFPDIAHQAGGSWPPAQWAPVAVATLRQSPYESAESGPASVVVVPPGQSVLWAEESDLPAAPRHVRSDQLSLACEP